MPGEFQGCSPASELPDLQAMIKPKSTQKEPHGHTRQPLPRVRVLEHLLEAAGSCWPPCRGLNVVPPAIHVHLEPPNVTLFENRVFADIISQDLEMISSNNDGVFLGRGEDTQREEGHVKTDVGIGVT